MNEVPKIIEETLNDNPQFDLFRFEKKFQGFSNFSVSLTKLNHPKNVVMHQIVQAINLSTY